MQDSIFPKDAPQSSLPSSDVSHSPSLSSINLPTFTTPDMRVPSLAPPNLAEPGVNFYPEFTPDPLVSNLTTHDALQGLDLSLGNEAASSPAEALLNQQAYGIDIIHDGEQPDPLLPDLQHPDLTQQAHMQDRPADLDPSALQVMHLDLTYQQLNQKTYPEVFMDQSGINTSRSRHMDLLMRGLDTEEY